VLAWFGVDEPGAICELELQTRQIEFWESRCRLAVEALHVIYNTSRELTVWDTALNATEAIGPLPDKQP